MVAMTRFRSWFQSGLLLALIAFQSVVSASAEGEPRPYKHVFIFNGGAFRTPVFLGMLQATIDRGVSPDLIIGTCGGSVAAAIANFVPSKPGASAYLEFLSTDRIYQFYRSIRMTKYTGMGQSLRLAVEYNGKGQRPDRRPDLFHEYMFGFPQDLTSVLPELAKFPVSGGIPVVIQAAELAFGPEVPRVNPRGQGFGKYLKITYFTDPMTATHLSGVKEGLALQAPQSAITEETQVFTGVNLAHAVRASIADPYLFEPHPIDGRYYITGATDLYPYELGKTLGKEVSFVFNTLLKPIFEEGAVRSTFKYNARKRAAWAYRQDYLYSVDTSDLMKNPEMAAAEVTMKPNWSKLTFDLQVPRNLDDYQDRVRKMYEFGYRRMVEAIAHPHSQDHVRVRRPLKIRL
jgi:predicted acylesterase/phospholipase RssA